MNAELEKIKKTIMEYGTRIATETAKLQEDAQVKREERERKLQHAKSVVDECEAQLRIVNDQLRENQEKNESYGRDIKAAEAELKQADDLIRQCAAQIDRCQQQAKDKLVPYGRAINEVLQRIKEAHWNGRPPTGPLGVHVSLRDQKWADLMRIQLGQLMTSFAITDARDRGQLKKILHDTGK